MRQCSAPSRSSKTKKLWLQVFQHYKNSNRHDGNTSTYPVTFTGRDTSKSLWASCSHDLSSDVFPRLSSDLQSDFRLNSKPACTKILKKEILKAEQSQVELRRCWWKSPTLKGTVSWHNGWMSPPSVLPPCPVYLPFSFLRSCTRVLSANMGVVLLSLLVGGG